MANDFRDDPVFLGTAVRAGPLKRNRWSRCVERPLRYLILGELACSGTFPGGLSAMFLTRNLEIEPLISVLLTV